jgi:hypothetical protein
MKDFMKVGFSANGPLFEPGLVQEVQEVINTGLMELAIIEGANKVRDQLWGPPRHKYNQSTASQRHGKMDGTLKRSVGATDIKDNVVRVDAGETLLGKDLVYASRIEKQYKMFEKAARHMRDTPGLWDKYIGLQIARILK